MKQYFKMSLSSFILAVVFVCLGLLLTGHKQEKDSTNMGNVSTDSECANVYVECIDVTFKIPKDWIYFFVDTKNGMKPYMTALGITFMTFSPDETYAMEVRTDVFATTFQDDDLIVADEAELQAFAEEVREYLKVPEEGYEPASNMTQEVIRMNGHAYIVC